MLYLEFIKNKTAFAKSCKTIVGQIPQRITFGNAFIIGVME